MDSAALEFPTHALRERVVANLIAKSLRRMEAEGASLASQISAAPLFSASSRGGEAGAPAAPAAPLGAGAGSRLDTSA